LQLLFQTGSINPPSAPQLSPAQHIVPTQQAVVPSKHQRAPHQNQFVDLIRFYIQTLMISLLYIEANQLNPPAWGLPPLFKPHHTKMIGT
jgi:hypothetical protein